MAARSAVIVYVDSSVLVRAYLSDEDGHQDTRRLLGDPDLARISGSLTPIEVSGALVRAARHKRGKKARLLKMLDADLVGGGPVTIVDTPSEEVVPAAIVIAREHGLRALDAWHLAVAGYLLPSLAERGEAVGFATRDKALSKVATSLGFEVV